MKKIILPLLFAGLLVPTISVAGYSSAVMQWCQNGPRLPGMSDFGCTFMNIPVWINPPPVIM